MADDLLYHYTDLSALKGIVESHALWASDLEFVNDAQELQYGRSVVREQLVAEAERILGTNDEHSAQGSRARAMGNSAHELERRSDLANGWQTRVYAACFCQEGDLLSQWRGYAPDDGYAIGFDRSELSKCTISGGFPGVRPALVAIEYGDKAIASAVNEILSNIAPSGTGHSGTTGYYDVGRVILPCLASIKHPAFIEEQEWRLIVASDISALPEFRASSRGLVPYLGILYPQTALRSITVGPGAHAELRELGIRRWLSAHSRDSVEVRRSSAPYRA